MSHNFGRFLDLPTICYWEYHLSADTGERDCDVYGVDSYRRLGAYLR